MTCKCIAFVWIYEGRGYNNSTLVLGDNHVKKKNYFCISYHIQASQCAIKANVAIRSTKTAAPYSEYLSILRATLTNLNKRAVLRRPIKVVVCKYYYFLLFNLSFRCCCCSIYFLRCKIIFSFPTGTTLRSKTY